MRDGCRSLAAGVMQLRMHLQMHSRQMHVRQFPRQALAQLVGPGNTVPCGELGFPLGIMDDPGVVSEHSITGTSRAEDLIPAPVPLPDTAGQPLGRWSRHGDWARGGSCGLMVR